MGPHDNSGVSFFYKKEETYVKEDNNIYRF